VAHSVETLGYGKDDRDSIPATGNDGIFFLIAFAFRPPLGSIQLPIQWVPGAPTPGVKRPGFEADHSFTSI
jgi:hypothetical protein